MARDWKSLRTGARDQRRVDHVGYIFQQFNLLPYLSVIDNVLMPCRFSALRAGRASESGTMEDAARTLLQGLGLPREAWTKSASALSVGQQQRVAAARALIGHPEVVIADEPTSALDEERRDAFMELLLTRCAEASSALVFVSHDARLARHFERVIELPAVNRAAVAESAA
jgi:putative ABC transport system ATP-binding protein